MIEVLVGVVALGVWHAVLVRFGATNAWARAAIRISLGLAILGETGRVRVLETLPWRTRGNDPNAMQEALGRSMDAAFWLDSGVAIAMGSAAAGLLFLSIRHVWRNRTNPPAPDPGTKESEIRESCQ